MRKLTHYLFLFCIIWGVLGVVFLGLLPSSEPLIEETGPSGELTLDVKRGSSYYLSVFYTSSPEFFADLPKPVFTWAATGIDASKDIEIYPASFNVEISSDIGDSKTGRTILKVAPTRSGKLSIKCDLPPGMHFGVQRSGIAFLSGILATLLGAAVLTLGLIKFRERRKTRTTP
jgi:hypothetical protein